MPNIFTVVTVSSISGSPETVYTLSGTHYGRLLLVCTGEGEIETFAEYARQTLKPGFEIKTVSIIARDLDQFRAEVKKRRLFPSGPSRVAVEGTAFFDEVIAQLMADTIWAEDTSGPYPSLLFQPARAA
jgi:hypothetical protein